MRGSGLRTKGTVSVDCRMYQRWEMFLIRRLYWCGFSFQVSRMYDMIDHVSIDHKRDDVVIEDLEFDNFQAFEVNH